MLKIKEKSIICDIDGTLAIMGERSPFKVKTSILVDTLNEPVASILSRFKDSHTIIFVTGRNERDREITNEFIGLYMKWLENEDYLLFMRPDGDYRQDCVVKKEIYNTFIKDNTKVEFALEDRDQMVDMYRQDLNIPCLQVNYGRF